MHNNSNQMWFGEMFQHENNSKWAAVSKRMSRIDHTEEELKGNKEVLHCARRQTE